MLKMKPIPSALVAGLALFAIQLCAQPLTTTITPQTISGAVGSTIDLQLKVTNFTNVATFQCPIKYDAAVLQFLSADNFGLPGMTAANSLANPLTPSPRVTVSYLPDFSQYPDGVTVPANTVVMTMHFKVVASGTATVNLASNVPPGIEVINNTGNTITVNFQSGGSTVTGGTGGPPPNPNAGFQVRATADTVAPNENFCMPVRVNDFDLIASMQYSMEWDKSILQYTGVQDFNLPGLDASSFGIGTNAANPTKSYLNTQWNDPAATGVNRADNATIYKVCFKAIGAGGTSTEVKFNGLGFPLGSQFTEVYNGNGQNVWDNTVSNQPATIKIEDIIVPPPANATTISLDTVSTTVNGSICSHMRVKNFNDIVVLQAGFTYDPTKLTFESIQLGTNPLGLVVGAGVFHQLATNSIKASWTDPAGGATGGVDLPDGTSLFSVCFKVLGPAGMTTPLDIKDLPNFPVEIYQQQGNNTVLLTPALVDGHIYARDVPQCLASVVVDNTVAIKCNGGSDGAINITASGSGTQFTYNWSGPTNFTNTNADISGLKAGVYNLTVTNPAGPGCTATTTVTLTEPTAVAQPTITPTGVNCFGGNDGSIALTVTGGTAPYTFSWAGPAPFTSTQQNPTGLVSGNYTVTVTDANGCRPATPSTTVLVPQPTAVAVPPANIQVTHVKCLGEMNGSINVTATGGTGPYTYTWSSQDAGLPTTVQAPPLTGLKKGRYSLSVTDSKGCTIIIGTTPANSIAVTEPTSAPIAAVDGQTNVKCFNDENGTVALTAFGGSAPLSFKWVNTNAPNVTVSTLEDPTNFKPGTYALTVTDANGCTTTPFPPTLTITGPSSPLTGTLGTPTNINCFGETSGSANVNISGGWPGAPTVAWSNTTQTGTSISGLAAGTYVPTITDAGGCSITLAGATVGGPTAAIAFGNTTVKHVTCHNQNDGQITITLTGGTAPYPLVQWSGTGLLGTQISNLAGGSYVATVTDSKGCTSVQPAVTVNNPAVLDASGNVVDQDGNTPGSITVTPTGGTQPYTYKWQPNSSSTNVITGNAGTYTVTVTDNNGCTFVKTFTMNNSLPILSAVVIDQKGSCDGANGCVTIVVSAANATGNIKPYKIQWTPGGNAGVTSSSDTIEICGLEGGKAYNFTVTSTGGPSLAATLPGVILPTLPSVSHSFVLSHPNEDFADGELDLIPENPSGTYSYQWNYQNATTQDLMNLDSGTYVVTITDTETGCSTVRTFYLERKYKPLKNDKPAEVTRPSCVKSENGTIEVFITGGNKPFVYKWSGPGLTATDTSSTIENLGSGFYSVTVTDENGTTLTGNWTLTPLSNLEANYAVTPGPNGWDVSGPDECDGQVTLSATGFVPPLTYAWSDNSTTVKNSDMCAGDWWAVVTDAAGCKDTLTGELTAPEGVLFAVSVSDFNGYNVKCHGGNEGQAAVSLSGGVPPYSVKWSTGFTETLNSSSGVSQQKQLKAGDYNVTVTDANGVKSQKVITVTQPDSLVLDFAIELPKRFTECDGEIVASVNGVDPVTYQWVSKFKNGNTQKADELCAGETVSWSAIDANGCRANGEITMGYPDDGCLVFSPVLTPAQADDKNDVLLITCVESVPENSLEIYNRWGQLVYKAESYDNDSNKAWKGTNSKGQALPEGVYFYVFTFINQFDEEEQRKGYINVLR